MIAATPKSAAPDTVSKGRILVVDDDRLVLATVTHGLAQAGYEVIDADNGDDAILLAREHRPALALLDIRMEGKSGFDVAATLRDAYRIPFIFLSAFSDPATTAQVRALGALAYLVKPLEVAQIVPTVDAAFARLRDSTCAAGEPGHGVATTARPMPAPVAVNDASAGGSPPDGAGLVTGAAAETGATLAAPAAVAEAAPTPPADMLDAVIDRLADPVPLAVGVLMHRHSLTRRAAVDRLRRMAAQAQTTPATQAERLLGAVEELARSAL